MFVFYNWPFPHMYFAKNVANIIGKILGSVFSNCVVFYGDRHTQSVIIIQPNVKWLLSPISIASNCSFRQSVQVPKRWRKMGERQVEWPQKTSKALVKQMYYFFVQRGTVLHEYVRETAVI